MRRILAVLVVALVAGLAAVAPAPAPVRAQAPAKPNIVVVMTDDQDVRTLTRIPGLPAFDSPCQAPKETLMPCLHEHVLSRGVTFDQHTAAYPLCCPSRATYITGQYPHTHGVRSNGDYDALDKEHILPVWLQRAGYATGYAGKYQGPLFLAYHPDHPDGRPQGWDRFWGLVDGAGVSAYNFYNYVIDADGLLEPHGSSEAEYQTDVLTGKAVGFIEEREASDAQPFFLSVGYVGPHWSNGPDGGGDGDLPGFAEGDPGFEAQQAPPVPAPRHMDELRAMRAAGLEAPRTPSFDEEDLSDKPAFVQSEPPLSDAVTARIDRWYGRRLASLLSVDEGIGRIVETLSRTGELENTVFVFTADNGWMQGQHRLAFQKQHAYEESARVPLVIAGAGLAGAATVDEPTSNVDLAGTIAALAGAQPDHLVDGMDLSPYLRDPALRKGRAILQESTTGEAGYAAVRTRRYRWVEYNTGERELYDLERDPFELESRHEDPAFAPVRERLIGVLDRLRDCRGAGCVIEGQDVAEPAPAPAPGPKRLRFADRRGDGPRRADLVAATAVRVGNTTTFAARTARRFSRGRLELRRPGRIQYFAMKRTGRRSAAVTLPATRLAGARWRVVAVRGDSVDRAPERFAPLP